MEAGELFQYPAEEQAVPPAAIGEPPEARKIGDLQKRGRRGAGETGHRAVKISRLVRDVVEEIEYMLAELKRDSIGASANALVHLCIAPKLPGVGEHDRHVAHRPRVGGLQQMRGWVERKVAGRTLR